MIPEGVEIVDYRGRVLDQDMVATKVLDLRNMIITLNKLRKVRRDDLYLLRYLHFSKFDVAQAYKRVEMYYDFIVDFPDWFHTPAPADSKDLLDRNMRLVLNGRDRQGRSIYLAKIGNADPSQVTLKDVSNVDDMWIELAMDDPMVHLHGLCVIADLSRYSWKLFKWLTPKNLKYLVRKMHAMPFVFKVHMVNTSLIVDASVNLMWPFLDAKLKESVFFHDTNWESLHKHISPEVLPPEYGGTAHISFDKLNEKLVQQNNDFLEKTKYIRSILNIDN